MGKSNIIMKQFLRNRKRFADLFNGVLFEGMQIVNSEELQEIDSESSMITVDKHGVKRGLQKYRDITMLWKEGVKLVVLACENQNKIHYAMPVRMMLYDGLSYSDQIRQIWQKDGKQRKLSSEEFLSGFGKEDKIYPVISIVFYYGVEKWDASIDLYGMFHEELFEKHQSILKKYIPNYPLNLIDVGEITAIDNFRTDLQLIFGMLQYKNEMNKMREYVNQHHNYFSNIDLETYLAIGELLHSESKMKITGKRSNEEGMDMCKALDDLYNSGVNAGIEQGICAFVEACKEIGLSKETICAKLKEKFSVTEEKAAEYLEK